MNVDGISIAKALEIEDASVTSGSVSTVTGHLILETHGGAEIDAGQVRPDLPWLLVENYGAVGDGVTDDTAAINDALAAGSVMFAAKTYKVDGVLVFPADKSQLGVGSGATKFLLGNAGKILLGSTTDVPTPREAGVTGMFTIEGNNTTPIGLHTACVGRGRVMQDIMVFNCFVNVFVEGSQNMLWLGLDVANGGYGIILDRGAGGNNFIGLQTLNQTVCGMQIRNSGDPTFPPGTYYPSTLGCTDNHFTNSRFEIPQASCFAEIHIQAGLRNQFHNCLISGQNLDGTKSAVVLDNSGGATASYTLFENCNIQGDGACGAGLTSINTGSYTIVKNCIITNFVVNFKADDMDFFWCDGNYPQNQDVGTYFAPVAGASSSVLTAFRGPDPTPWLPFGVAAWTAGADTPQVRRVGPRVEYRGTLQSAASGGIPTTMATGLPAPADARIATYGWRNELAAESFAIQMAGSNMVTNCTLNNRKMFLDGLAYDVDQ